MISKLKFKSKFTCIGRNELLEVVHYDEQCILELLFNFNYLSKIM